MKNIVKQFELDLLDQLTRKNTKKLDTLLANDFFEFTQSGLIYNKQDIITILPTLPKENFSVIRYQEKKLSDDIILTHYVANRVVIKNGLRRRTLCSSIWQFIDNRWQIIFFQGTPAKDKLSG